VKLRAAGIPALAAVTGLALGTALSSPAPRSSTTTTTTTTINEDDPRWDCRTMGNHQCGTTLYFNLDGELYGFDVNAPDRPGCFVEPSNTKAGYEVVFYSRISGRGAPEFLGDPLGFEVTCP
jgi:hypothetical protein